MQLPVNFTILDSVDSTNNYAMERIHAGLASHGMAWMTREQTNGRGQRGKHWESEPGENIVMSMVFQPGSLQLTSPFLLSASLALGCQEFFSIHSGEKIKIKWPNDLYYNDRKAGGILIETIYRGKEWKWAVAGIGININQVNFDERLPNPVSLKQVTGQTYDAVALSMELHQIILKRINAISKNNNELLMDNYQQHLYKLNEKVILKKGNSVFETIVKGVNKMGQLITTDTIERKFEFGEIEWVI